MLKSPDDQAPQDSNDQLQTMRVEKQSTRRTEVVYAAFVLAVGVLFLATAV